MKNVSRQDAHKFELFIKNHEFFLIAGHKEPDGDAVSSCMAVAAIVRHFGKQYQLLSAGPFKRAEVAKHADFFTSEVQFLSNEDIKRTGLIIVDCSEYSRLGDLDGDISGIDTFIIDHHKTASCPENAEFYIDDTSPSCSNIIQQFYELIVGELSKEVAENLFFGVCTDTGFMRYLSPGDGNVFVNISRLVDAGGDPRGTYDKMTGGKAFKTRKLLGVLLEKTELYYNGKLALTYETLDDTQKYGSDGRDSDALYQLLLSVEGVQAVAFLRQESANSCTGGFRSRGNIDVSSVAAKFGGGGHKNASGMSCEGKLDSLIPSVCKEFARIL